ncbi:MAG: hypothetical protein AAB049_00935, partial [Nitrospirota bacterium]
MKIGGRVHRFYVVRVHLIGWCMLWASIMPAYAEEVTPVVAEAKDVSDWHYGGFVDLSYPINFNFPENHLWRSRSTAARHNELAPNMAVGYIRKDIAAESRWGMELGVQGGYDSKDFAFLQGEKEVAGADTLRH